MPRQVPQWISRTAIVVGTLLFLAALRLIDWDETLRTASRVGLALPLILLPGAAWHLLRALGWHISFPEAHRPGYWRVFQVRLASDGVAYFTIRGLASEPLRVVLLLDRVPAAVSAAASVLERTAMGIVSVTLVGVAAVLAMTSDQVPAGWQTVFQGIAMAAILVLGLTAFLLTREGRYLGPLFERIHQRTGWHWTGGRVVHFVSEVEALFLLLARTDRRRLRQLALIGFTCYGLMAAEVWVVFWAIGEPIGLFTGVIVETFTRSASVAGGMIPANLGALEASNVAVVNALGLTGAGSLALSRRIRSLLWAGLGLAIFPKDALRAPREPKASVKPTAEAEAR